MPIYRTNELSLDLPRQLKDKSLHIFTAVEDGPSPFSLVISRTPVAASETLAGFGRRLLGEISRALADFQLLRNVPTTVDSEPALLLDYAWSNQGAPMRQCQVSLLYAPAPGVVQAVQITATMAVPTDESWTALFDDVLSSVQLNRPAQPAKPPGAASPGRIHK